MKVGDLVTLSSYGYKRDFNRYLDPNHIGIIVSCNNPWASYPYKVMWCGLEDSKRSNLHSRRELKYAKRTT